jgi:hypothetical protein
MLCNCYAFSNLAFFLVIYQWFIDFKSSSSTVTALWSDTGLTAASYSAEA